MHAVCAHQPGGAEVLRYEERPVPQPGPEEVLIAVRAAGVNRPDIFQRQGLYPPPKGVTDILGLEVSGKVIASGRGVPESVLGTEVCALLAGGGYADYAVAPLETVLAKPKNLSLRDCAGLPESVFTVWANVFERGCLQSDETLLVHGGASGIGVMALQMARAYGARVFTTVGSSKKAEFVKSLGADRAVLYKEEDFLTCLSDAGGVDVILDMVGGAYVEKNLRLLKKDGRLIQIAFLEGSRISLDLMPVMLKRLTLTGSTLRSRPLSEKKHLAQDLKKHVWPWLERGEVSPVTDRVFPLSQAAMAHAYMEKSAHMGKILLAPDSLFS